MKTMYKIAVIIALCFSPLFIQCSSDDSRAKDEQVLNEDEMNEIIQLKKFISYTRGFDLKDITYDAEMACFVIGGDMKISLKDAREEYKLFKVKNYK